MKKNIISIISFVAAFFAVQYGIDYYREYTSIKIVDAQVDALREEARNNNSDEPEVLALAKSAANKTEEMINSKSSKKEKLQIAASTFLGFYLVNYKQRAEYCQNQGVDITPFTSAFKESHKNEYAIAVKALADTSLNVDKLFTTLKHQLVTVIEQDMEYIAYENSVSLAGACQLISDNSATLVPQMHISVMNPLVYGTLQSDI